MDPRPQADVHSSRWFLADERNPNKSVFLANSFTELVQNHKSRAKEQAITIVAGFSCEFVR